MVYLNSVALPNKWSALCRGPPQRRDRLRRLPAVAADPRDICRTTADNQLRGWSAADQLHKRPAHGRPLRQDLSRFCNRLLQRTALQRAKMRRYYGFHSIGDWFVDFAKAYRHHLCLMLQHALLQPRSGVSLMLQWTPYYCLVLELA